VTAIVVGRCPGDRRTSITVLVFDTAYSYFYNAGQFIDVVDISFMAHMLPGTHDSTTALLLVGWPFCAFPQGAERRF
jgi:hypothetical protein